MPNYSRQRLFDEATLYRARCPDGNSLELKVLRCFNSQPTLVGMDGESARPLRYNNLDHWRMYKHAVDSDFDALVKTLSYREKDDAVCLYKNCWALFADEVASIEITEKQRKEQKERKDREYEQRRSTYSKGV